MLIIKNDHGWATIDIRGARVGPGDKGRVDAADFEVWREGNGRDWIDRGFVTVIEPAEAAAPVAPVEVKRVALVDPAPVEPVEVEPVETEPVEAEPVEAEPAEAAAPVAPKRGPGRPKKA